MLNWLLGIKEQFEFIHLMAILYFGAGHKTKEHNDQQNLDSRQNNRAVFIIVGGSSFGCCSGGGSSWSGTLASPVFQGGVRSGNGQVTISWQ